MTNVYAQQAAAIRELIRLAEGNPTEGPTTQTLEEAAGVLWYLDEMALEGERDAA